MLLPMPVYSKHFTLEEAREILPEVRQRLRRLQSCVVTLEKQGFRFGPEPIAVEVEGGFSKNGNGKHSFPIEYLEMLKLFQEFGELGIEVKSPSDGLIDFPAFTPDGEEVYLCYLEGEADILYWHTLDGGFSGRRPLAGTFTD